MSQDARRPTQTDQAYSKDALIARSRERAKRLVEDDPLLAQLSYSRESVEAFRACPSAIECIAKAFELYAERPCFGERVFEANEGDGAIRFLPEFRTIRYSDVWGRVERLASGLRHEGLVGPGAFVGIVGFGSVDWVVANLSCIYLAAVSAPLQVGMSQSDLSHIVRTADLTCIVCSAEQLDAIEAVLPQCPSVRGIVIMDVREGDHLLRAKVARWQRDGAVGAHLTVRTMAEVEERGRSSGIVPKFVPSDRPGSDPLMSLVYTSGSTGVPKGAMVPESVMHMHWKSLFSRATQDLEELPRVTLNYMPLNHLGGWGNIIRSIAGGGLTYFVAKSDMSTLFEDIRLTRPTMLLLVPRVAEMAYQHYLGELVRATSSMSSTDLEEERKRTGERIMASMRDTFLGDRLLLVITGTAPTPPEVVSFLERCFEVPVVDGYGSTEAGPLTIDGIADPSELSWKLVDLPELGYRTSDKPYPRGELHVKSVFTIPGYYKDERATKELFDEEGYLNTGDIVEQRGPNRLVWIDRAKNVLKLSQGEFVAISRLEGLFVARSTFIRQMFVYG
ncbi:MAG TPA: AMP-binding protein, partial [Labilithrix sp.]|nr:AMP-binding protein [Labilithrix sp.]